MNMIKYLLLRDFAYVLGIGGFVQLKLELPLLLIMPMSLIVHVPILGAVFGSFFSFPTSLIKLEMICLHFKEVLENNDT